jgi:hypothetical protein
MTPGRCQVTQSDPFSLKRYERSRLGTPPMPQWPE